MFFAVPILGLLFAPFVAVQIQEHIFRHRAEQLLADMRSLMMRKPSLAEIDTVFKRWRPSEPWCNEDDCWFQSDISYGSFFHFLDYSSVPDIAPLGALDQPKVWLLPFRMYGGRRAHVRACARVIHHVVWGILFQVDLEIWAPPDESSNVKEWRQQNILSGAAVRVSRFGIPDDWQGLALHPNYVIEEGLPPRGQVRMPDVYARFGPHAEPADISRLSSFDLSCLTRLAPCREPRDLMPEAAAQFAKEEPQLEQARNEHVCGPAIVALMARDAGRVGVVEVTESRTEHLGDWGAVPVPSVRLIQDFEPANDWKIGDTHELVILDAKTNHPGASLPAEVYPGNRLLMLAESGFHYRWVETYRCGIVPLNPANLELVRNAISGNVPPAKP